MRIRKSAAVLEPSLHSACFKTFKTLNIFRGCLCHNTRPDQDSQQTSQYGYVWRLGVGTASFTVGAVDRASDRFRVRWRCGHGRRDIRIVGAAEAHGPWSRGKKGGMRRKPFSAVDFERFPGPIAFQCEDSKFREVTP
jgi:hypothetical protein